MQKIPKREYTAEFKEQACVFRTKPATDSITKLPPIPRQTCHRFR